MECMRFWWALGTLSDSHLEHCVLESLGPSSSLSSTVIRAREGSVVGESNLVLVPVLCSATEASRVPLTSVSRGTWIWDMPQGVRGSPTCGFDLPQQFLPLAAPLFPSATWMRTCSWLSETVMEVCLLETTQLCFTYSPDSTGSSIPNERARPPRPRNPQRFLACLKLSNKKRKVSKTSRVQREIVQQKPVKSRWLQVHTSTTSIPLSWKN